MAKIKEDVVLSFEEAMDQLEQLVGKLENGDVPLEKAIDLFQEGMKLSHLCSQKLEQVERKIEILVEENGALNKKPFTNGADEA
ncbi:exodeoxyribonuclease VII small subunit [Paenibacillus psychroresistens]|uniref:Exodeoxyribonuclease 7 small subunit n=1 Tax=Paenibacillus psychroresistens TaxID=1778678 RepID=A0A6B8RM50_9BACL|nr:exodeoxyribonuclease VII small subunit [Paenibacillus psychroresistens]QGQ97099.1 exodeoxyribonuclease VII small subunit [Paenibacillus psychroresistens]